MLARVRSEKILSRGYFGTGLASDAQERDKAARASCGNPPMIRGASGGGLVLGPPRKTLRLSDLLAPPDMILPGMRFRDAGRLLKNGSGRRVRG
jgi:hypothetical protein